MTRAQIIAAARSPVVPQHGALAHLDLHAIAAPVITALLEQTDLAPDAVDELIVSNALGAGGNPARRVALAAGLPERIAGLSIDRQCAGGLDAVLLARQMILSGAAQIVIAGGVESYSRRPLRAHQFADGRAAEPYDQAPFTPWPERDPDMAQAADALAGRLNISRAAQEGWAMASHAKARAQKAPSGEIVPLEGLQTDPFARNLTPRTCARAPVVCGSITAANMAVAADGAAFCIVVSAQVARDLGRQGVSITSGATLGSDPTCPGLAPLPAIQRALDQAGLKPADLQAAEVMEAFAVQAIACVQGAGLPPDIVNSQGGALARGHPIGASGAINVVRLFHRLRAQGGDGLATIAAAGGIGSAVVLSA